MRIALFIYVMIRSITHNNSICYSNVNYGEKEGCIVKECAKCPSAYGKKGLSPSRSYVQRNGNTSGSLNTRRASFSDLIWVRSPPRVLIIEPAATWKAAGIAAIRFRGFFILPRSQNAERLDSCIAGYPNPPHPAALGDESALQPQPHPTIERSDALPSS